MCVAKPVKIITIKNNLATVDLGDSNTTIVDISLLDANVGDYLIVNTGFGIRIVDEEEAQETIELWNRMQEFYKDET